MGELNQKSSAFGKDYQKCHDTEYDIRPFLKRWPVDALEAVFIVDDTLMKVWIQEHPDDITY